MAKVVERESGEVYRGESGLLWAHTSIHPSERVLE